MAAGAARLNTDLAGIEDEEKIGEDCQYLNELIVILLIINEIKFNNFLFIANNYYDLCFKG